MRGILSGFVAGALMTAAAAEPQVATPEKDPPPCPEKMQKEELLDFCSPLAVDLTTYKFRPDQGYYAERGGGTIIHDSGYILAAAHATSHGILHTLLLADRTRLGFRIMATAWDYDTAIVKVDTTLPLRAARIGRDSSIDVGDDVLMIGNPDGKAHTIHHSVVKHMNVEGGRFKVSGSDVNPGDSGGSVFNNRGELVGMVQLKLLEEKETGAAIRMDHLCEGFSRILLDEDRREYKVGIKVDTLGPALVNEVKPDSPAEAAGIRVGDTIRRMGGLRIDHGLHYVLALIDIDSTAPRILKFERGYKTYQTMVGPIGPELRAPVDMDDPKPGLHCNVYTGRWHKLPDFAQLTSSTSHVAEAVCLQGVSSNRNHFGMTFYGCVRVPGDGKWTFFTESDDGSKLWVHDELVVQNDNLHTALQQGGSILLKEGWHPIRIHYFDMVGPQALSMLFMGPGVKKQEVPADMLRHAEKRSVTE